MEKGLDERHWWIAGKIQESFKIGGYDNPTLLEDFISESTTLDMINSFLNVGGPNRLFFYCDKSDAKVLSTRQLHILGSLSQLKDVVIHEITILYFLRHTTETDVDRSHMERDIFCGELKGNPLETFHHVLSDIYLPLFREQQEWGQCSADAQNSFIVNLEKHVGALTDSSSSSYSAKQWMLKQPENLIGTDFKHQRLAALDQQLISEYEQLVTDWIGTIEQILTDSSDERFMDPNAGPLSELERWKRRHRLLVSITEQLKSKECKAVTHVLVTAKSRLLKKWKIIDAGISDAMNDTKDKVRYLESLKRHLDELYGSATPISIMNSALPNIMTAIKQMESVSRYYARQGFLGLLFTKITNQLVLSCKSYIHQSTVVHNGIQDDTLWQKILDEVRKEQIHQKDTSTKNDKKIKQAKNSDSSSDSLFGSLKLCLSLQSSYREFLRTLKDSFGHSHNLSHFTSISSIGLSPGPGGANKSRGPPTVVGRQTRASMSSKRTVSAVAEQDSYMVSVADEETIMAHLDMFCSRIRQAMDIITTLAQFQKMVPSTVGLPKPRKEDLVINQTVEEVPQVVEELPATDLIQVPTVPQDHSLHAIVEDDEVESSIMPSSSVHGETLPTSKPTAEQTVTYTDTRTQGGLSKMDVQLLKQFYSDQKSSDGCTMSEVVEKYIAQLSNIMNDTITTDILLDVETKDKVLFEDMFAEFMTTIGEMEQFVNAYLNAVFTRRMKIKEGLDIMMRFTPIQHRSGVCTIINEKFVDIFNWYESDLEKIHQIYDDHKAAPPVPRNAPPISGKVSWSRQLMKRIEDPMLVFRENKAICQLKDFGRIVRIYNRLASALVTFETLLFTNWINFVDHVCHRMKSPLLAMDPSTNEVIVNADQQVIEVIEEAKFLRRLGMTLPDNALQLVQQEKRLKGYKMHLEEALDEFNHVRSEIPVTMKVMFEQHVNKTAQNFQPGLTTLAWNSMNIDAFLHQLFLGTKKLRQLVTLVNDVMASKVVKPIKQIKEMILFDHVLAFSKSWTIHEFVEAMLESIKVCSVELHGHLKVIESGIQDCAGILSNKKSLLKNFKSEDFTKSLESSMVGKGDTMASELLEHHVHELYQAVLLAITRSLVTLAESSGCEGKAIRAASALSDAPSSRVLDRNDGMRTPRPHEDGGESHRLTSASTERPVSVLSMLSNATWTTEKTDETTYLQFDVDVKFEIPDIVFHPPIENIQTALDTVAKAISDIPTGLNLSSDPELGDNFSTMIDEDELVGQIQEQFSNVIHDLRPSLRQHIAHFNLYDFLWQDDMLGNYYDFIRHDPGTTIMKREVERMLKIEQKVLSIPDVLPAGSVRLQTHPIKNTLHGFAMTWKAQYASVLHEEAKKKLQSAVTYRTNVWQRLELNVVTLDQLNSTLHLLEEVRDMENKIDDIYLPIEQMYVKLREFDLRLPRPEVEAVDSLRDDWQALLNLADNVQDKLLKEKRKMFEQELDKQVKNNSGTFVVEVIQFRNAFDAQGPAVPGIEPSEAVIRLQDFQQRYQLYETKRKTLDSVSKLFGIVCKSFLELDRTGEELVLLGSLYGLFQNFLQFQEKFRNTLWAEVDLETASREVESCWDECLALPSKLKDWDAYNDMKGSIQFYLDLFSLLQKLASKEIRNRHWLQVMTVTGTSFQLEANMFKLKHLLDIDLMKHQSKVEEICRSASRELELEVKLRMTEEEWTEQVLNFEPYKKRGPMYLDKLSTERVLEQLEDAQALLAQMLTSRYIGPLREEAASWAEKLKEVAEVLEQWLEVQDLWQYLEEVFSNTETAKELIQESKRFARIDKGWTKMMKRHYDMRNVLQCCYGGEVRKSVLLRHLYEELEICFKSLMGYLDKKRHVFPRFYFLSDAVLLAVLSHPKDLDSVRPHLKSLFSAVADITLRKLKIVEEESSEITEGEIVVPEGRRSSTGGGHHSALQMVSPAVSATKIDKRLTQIHGGTQKSKSAPRKQTIAAPTHLLTSIVLPSESYSEEAATMEAISVSGLQGETLSLNEPVSLVGGVESWLLNIKDSITDTLSDTLMKMLDDVVAGTPCDELALKYPTQLCCVGILFVWTRECEAGIIELKYDRKALANTSKKFGVLTNKISSTLTRGSWRNTDESMTIVHKKRLENMASLSLFLRDLIDSMSTRKLRENTDFEWRRCMRLYLHEQEDEQTVAQFLILEDAYMYGCEFYGAQPPIAITPNTDKCFLSMSQAISQSRGSLLSGGTGVGKTETVKGFAQSLGVFLSTFQCLVSSNSAAVGKQLQGLAMDGCWGCFDDIHLLGSQSMSILLDHVQAIFSAMQMKNSFCYVGEGHEISVKNSLSVFLTYNPTFDSTHKLPNDIRSYFRHVTLLKPDQGFVLKAKCSAYGFRAPGVLATRLKIVSELAKDQLSTGAHHNFSHLALGGVLQQAFKKHKLVKDDKPAAIERIDKATSGDKKTSDDTSRSNSQVSMAPSVSVVPLQQQTTSTSLGMGKGRKIGTPNPLTGAAKMEHALVGQILLDMIMPRLDQENQTIFSQIVKDIFAGLPEPNSGSSHNITGSHVRAAFDLDAALESSTRDKGLIAHKPFLEKCVQLYNIAQVHQGLIIAGPPGSGKSSVMQSLVDGLCVASVGSKNRDITDKHHKLLKLYPLVTDKFESMFGSIDHNQNWVDGIFTSSWRKAARNQCTTWICLDAPLNSSWTDAFSSVLDCNKILSLANGDQLSMSSNMKLVFETDDLSTASPSLIARSGLLFMTSEVLHWSVIADQWVLDHYHIEDIEGLVYVDKTLLGWRPISRAWLTDRSQVEVHVLHRSFEKTVDLVTQYITSECQPTLQLSEIGMFQTCLCLLSAMLADNIEIGGELHIERLYLFCLMWTYGGLLDEKDKKGFNDLLATLSTALPDDDRDICFFDYYVDEAGEWDPWHSRVPDIIYNDNILGEVFIETNDTIRAGMLMQFAAASGQNILLVGPTGCGKSAIVNNFLEKQDSQKQVTKHLVYSGASTASQLQRFVQANIHHRQGFVYGAKENKKLQLIIDDIHLPQPDVDGVQRCNELLRRLLDDKTLCTDSRPFEWRSIEGLMVLGTMAISDNPSIALKTLSPRLLRHFAVVNVTSPEDECLKTIMNGILETNMSYGDNSSLDLDLHNQIVTASCSLYSLVTSVLKPAPMVGRKHYVFTLKDFVTCFQSIKKLADEDRANEQLVVSLWQHEIKCLISDRLCREADLTWFTDKLNNIVKETWPELDNLHQAFVTFSTDVRMYQRPVTSVSQKESAAIIQHIDSMDDVHTCLDMHLQQYNEEFGNVPLNLMLSDSIIKHVIKIHRVLSYHHGGNLLFVGPIGSHLATLCKLALHVMDIPIHQIDSSKQNTFLDGLRSAVRLSGAEGKTLTLFFTARDLKEDLYLDALNSLLSSGEYPHLFTNDELDGLLMALAPIMRRELTGTSVDLHSFFLSRVKANLHIIICLPPTHRLLTVAALNYPGLLSGTQLIWVCDWPEAFLIDQASYYLKKHDFLSIMDTDVVGKVVSCMANIHSFSLRESHQIAWAGDTSKEVQFTQIRQLDKKKEQIKIQQLKLPNNPYTKTIMLENIRQYDHQQSTLGTGIHVGPTTYQRFMDTFRDVFVNKAKHRTDTVQNLQKALETLQQTRADAKEMRDDIKKTTEEYEKAKVETYHLLDQLTAKATTLEKLKAKIGESSELRDYLGLNEFTEEPMEDEYLLVDDDRDQYDEEFEAEREKNRKKRTIEVKDEYENAVKTVEQCRKDLAYAKEQVIFWKGRVDRACIERMKAFQNPPVLVGQVMEMVMLLVGKRLPTHPPKMERDQSAGYPVRDEQSGRYSTNSSNSTRLAMSKKGKTTPMGIEKFDRASWKLIQNSMNDSGKFVDMLHNVPWEDGLNMNDIGVVESYLAHDKDGQLITGEGSLLENAQDKEKHFVASKQQPSGITRGITIASAKYSSEDAATLVQYTMAIVEYSRLCGPLKASLDKMQVLKREIEENERLLREQENKDSTEDEEKPNEESEEELNAEDLPDVEKQVIDLQDKFDLAVVNKHRLGTQLKSMKDRLRAAANMVDGLRVRESEWKRFVEANSSNDLLVANCLSAAAFLVYCSGINVDARARMSEFFMTICQHHKLPMATQLFSRDIKLANLLYTQMDLLFLERLQLPLTPLMLENASFVMYCNKCTAWPFLCDPSSGVNQWLAAFLKDKGFVQVRYSDMTSQFETCLAEGLPLLVTDVNVSQLANDPKFFKILHNRHLFLHGEGPFKLMVGDHEVECQPSFSLYLQTTSLPHEIPAEIAAYVSTIYFHHVRTDSEEMLLNRFMKLEKMRLNDEKLTLLQERLSNTNYLDELENKMLSYLSSDIRYLKDLNATKQLTELQKQYNETVESQTRIAVNEESIERAREGFRDIARRGAVLYDLSQILRNINPLVEISYEQFLNIYDMAISHSDRAAVSAVVDRLTQIAFNYVAKSMQERDRYVYTLLLAIEVEDSHGRVGLGEREFLISPALGSVTMVSAGKMHPPDSKFLAAKKPFDWMTDEQFNNLQILAIHYEWFQEMFERMPKDGRETQWRNLCENDHPENQALPDKMDESYTPMQRLLVIRAVRGDKLMQLTNIFINNTMGKRYLMDSGPDFTMALRQSSPTTPLLILFTQERNTAEIMFSEFANRKEAKTLVVPLSGTGIVEERKAIVCLQKAMNEGMWILLQNAHNEISLLNSLERMFAEEENIDSNFRVWITCDANVELPKHVLQTSIKLVIDTPRTMKDTMVRSFQWINWHESDLVKKITRPEWPVLLHNMCYLHAAIKLRARLGRGGWNNPADLTNVSISELLDVIKLSSLEFLEGITAYNPQGRPIPRNPSWTFIRYTLSEMLYGNVISNPMDQQSLNAMVDYWISPNAVKKDFELPKVRYKVPPVFHSGHPTLTQLQQSLNLVSNFQLEIPEACNIHHSTETAVSDDQYIFTRLNRLFDFMPSSETLSHQLFPKPPTAHDVFEGNQWTDEDWKIMPKKCPLLTNTVLTDNVLYKSHQLASDAQSLNDYNPIQQGVFASSSYTVLKLRKDVELWDICHNTLQKLPKAYNKEFVFERIKKIGGLTPFNIFLMRELGQMYKLITEIKTALQTIKLSCDMHSLGDKLSSNILSAAHDLYHLRVPQVWCDLACNTGPPQNYSLASWISDLTNRSQHYERILILGREKMPAYWLGAFFNPRALLSIFKQESYKQHTTDRSGNIENIVFQTELTARDKDHIREPPTDGIFIYGLYLWGAAWDKTAGELMDSPSRHTYAQLPVIHLTCWAAGDKPILQDATKASEMFQCPLFQSRISRHGEPVMEIDLGHAGVSSARWALRGLAATMRPY